MKDKDLIDIILRLSRALKRQRRSQEAPSSVSRGQYRIMRILQEEEGMRMGDLAERLDIRPASLSPQLKKMEEAGLIKRQKDPRDLRVVSLSLDEKGEEALALAKDRREKRRQEVNAWLTPEEYQEFARLSAKLMTALESSQEGREGDRHES